MSVIIPNMANNSIKTQDDPGNEATRYNAGARTTLKECTDIQEEIRSILQKDSRASANLKETIIGKVGLLMSHIQDLVIKQAELVGETTCNIKIMEEIEHIRKTTDALKHENICTSSPSTYAERVKNSPPQLRMLQGRPFNKSNDPALTQKEKVVYISSKDNQDITSDDLRKNFTNIVSPTKDKISVVSIKSTKQNSLRVVVNSEQDIDKLRKHPGLDKMTIEDPLRRNPRIILYDVDSTLNADNLKNCIIEQNLCTEDVNKLQVCFRTGPRDKARVHWVIEVSPDIRKRLLAKGRIFIEFSSVKIKDYLHIAKCFKCFDYGHIAKFCKDTQKCRKCGEQNHTAIDCASKEKEICIPCKNRKINCANKGQSDCPSYKLIMHRLIQNTNYGEH